MIAGRLRTRFGQLPTSVKLLALLNGALLPLGVVALIASIQAASTAQDERRGSLNVALADSARRVGDLLASDIAAMRGAANAVALGVPAAEPCTRLSALFGAETPAPRSFALFDVSEAPLCATRGFEHPRPPTGAMDSKVRAALDESALTIVVPGATGSAVVVARYPAATIRRSGRPAQPGFVVTRLANATTAIALGDDTAGGAPVERESATAPVGLLDLELTLSGPLKPFGMLERLAIALPVLMWAAASAITFILVNRLLIRPLRVLRAAIDGYKAGTPFVAPPSQTPAREIRELGIDIAAAFTNQTRATREVHHRVKNNLQIIASLISIHARGARSAEASVAYAAIQRRVDALAIVHRNHYAELDTGGTIDLRRLISEIASNLRANAEATDTTPPIALSAGAVGVTQDVAIAIGFLVTELIELSMTADPRATIDITLAALAAREGLARIVIESPSFDSSPAFEQRLTSGYARVIEGLGRQMRSPVMRKGHAFSVEFACAPAAAQVK